MATTSVANQIYTIPPATLTKEETYRVTGGVKIIDRWFKVPLDYSLAKKGEQIQVFARNAVPDSKQEDEVQKMPLYVYLQGGPGFECVAPKSHPLTEFLFRKGCQVLYLDQRGTGLSTPVSAETLAKRGGLEEQVEYLKLMRADNIVRDCESIRKCMALQKWRLIGQSFGGFCSVTYLSLHPEGLAEVITTGGMPPLRSNPDPIYERTWKRVLTRNEVYYKKYPQDVEAVKQIIAYLQQNKVKLPRGGTLTPERFLDLGLAFGGHGGIDSVHLIVQRAANDLALFGLLTRKLLQIIESEQGFDGNVLYAVLHEACYCQGAASDWSADRLKPPLFAHSNKPIYFTGEMISRSMFTSYAELVPLKPVAEQLARVDDWPTLYDVERLKQNRVPVYAANYIEDMYVDFGLASETIRTIKGAKFWETNTLQHNAVRAKTETVMGELWRLKTEEVD